MKVIYWNSRCMAIINSVKNLVIVLVTLFAIVPGVLFLSGCQPTVESNERDVEIEIDASAMDDFKTQRIYEQYYEEYKKETKVERINARDLGMVPNEPEARNENSDILFKAIAENQHIIFDDVYHLSGFDIPVQKDVLILEGIGNHELIFHIDAYSVLIDVNFIRSIKLLNLNVTNMTNEPFHLISNKAGDNQSLVDEVFIQSCHFKGNISVYRQSGSKELNPLTDDYGIKTFVFNNNEVTNTQLTFISLVNTPYDYVEIHDNVINNFMYVFAFFGIDNDYEFVRELKAAREFISVHGNIVRCDDDWWALTGQAYHAFVLTESNRVVYDSNLVEGLKADFEVAIYDAYLSSNSVVYTNNTWKNNICFYEDKIHNTLIKAKTGNNAVRLYDNNRFIVEEDFAERVGQSKELLFVYFIDINSDIDRFEITNNVFDVYDLRFQISSRVIHELIFNNNVINSNYVSGRMFIIKTLDDETTIEFNHNTIEVYQNDLQPFGEGQNNNRFGILQIIDGSNASNPRIKSLSMKANRIHAPIYYVFRNVRTEALSIEDNQFYYVEDLFSAVSLESDLPEELDIIMTIR